MIQVKPYDQLGMNHPVPHYSVLIENVKYSCSVQDDIALPAYPLTSHFLLLCIAFF